MTKEDEDILRMLKELQDKYIPAPRPDASGKGE